MVVRTGSVVRGEVRGVFRLDVRSVRMELTGVLDDELDVGVGRLVGGLIVLPELRGQVGWVDLWRLLVELLLLGLHTFRRDHGGVGG